jgi:carbon-monoxide dehydrogenase small subunit
MVIRFTINGEEHEFHGDPRTSLLNALRDTFRLTGGKATCSEGFCGTCTVHIGGELAVGCLKGNWNP